MSALALLTLNFSRQPGLYAYEFVAQYRKGRRLLFAFGIMAKISTCIKVRVENVTRLISIASCILLFNCVYPRLPLSVFANEALAETKVKAAGCFIPTPKGIVLTIHTVFRDIRIPFGSRESGESARQTAARETLEETGLDVTVGKLLRMLENDTALLFHCTPKTSIEDYSQLRPLDALEVSEVIVINPITMLNHDGRKIRNSWRFSEDKGLLMQLFEEYTNKETKDSCVSNATATETGMQGSSPSPEA